MKTIIDIAVLALKLLCLVAIGQVGSKYNAGKSKSVPWRGQGQTKKPGSWSSSQHK